MKKSSFGFIAALIFFNSVSNYHVCGNKNRIVKNKNLINSIYTRLDREFFEIQNKEFFDSPLISDYYDLEEEQEKNTQNFILNHSSDILTQNTQSVEK